MKFQKTLLINSTNYDKVLNGEIRLQCGQWVYFWDTLAKSRWVGVTKGGTMWAIHSTDPKSFKRLAARYKETPYNPNK